VAETIEIRPAEDGDRRALALLFAAVAEERDGFAAEPRSSPARALSVGSSALCVTLAARLR